MNINIIILGNQGVGKTTIIDSFIEKKFFPAEHPTLGIDTRVVNVKQGNQLIQYNYFDSEGSEKDNSTNLSFISKADGIILVYDGELSEEKKKTDLLKWQNIIGKYCTPDIYQYVWLVCNIKSKKRIVNIEKEKEIIKTLNYSTNLLSVIDYEDHTHKINPFFETVNNTILEKDAIKQRMGYKYQNERGWRLCIII